MSFVDGLMRLIHIAAAMAWFGGALLLVTRILPIMRRAGDAAIPFQLAISRYGGLGLFFAISSTLTILAGGHLYGNARVFDWAMTPQRMMLEMGVMLGTLAWILGIVMSFTVERPMKRLAAEIGDAPSGQQRTQWDRLIGKLGLYSHIMVAMVGIAVIGMAGRGMV